MMIDGKVCCMCGKNKKFLARINAGQKLYCMQCQTKITKEYGQDYWKSCSFQEFLEASSKSMEKNADESSNMFKNIKKTLQETEE